MKIENQNGLLPSVEYHVERYNLMVLVAAWDQVCTMRTQGLHH